MEVCEICKENGEIVEVKDSRGMAAHLRAKHNSMPLEEYRKKYAVVEIPVVETPKIETPTEPKNPIEAPEDLGKDVTMVVRDYTLLPNTNLSAMFVSENGVIESFRKVLALGTVEVNDSPMISAMVIADDGLLTPVFALPKFARIVERGTETKVPIRKVKKKLWFGRKDKKVKQEMKGGTELSEELIQEFSKFLVKKEKEKKV